MLILILIFNFQKFWYWFWYWVLENFDFDIDFDIEETFWRILILILILRTKFQKILILILNENLILSHVCGVDVFGCARGSGYKELLSCWDSGVSKQFWKREHCGDKGKWLLKWIFIPLNSSRVYLLVTTHKAIPGQTSNVCFWQKHFLNLQIPFEVFCILCRHLAAVVAENISRA